MFAKWSYDDPIYSEQACRIGWLVVVVVRPPSATKLPDLKKNFGFAFSIRKKKHKKQNVFLGTVVRSTK